MAGSKLAAGAKSSKLWASTSDLSQLAMLSTSTTCSITIYFYAWHGNGLTLPDYIAVVKLLFGSPSATDVRLPWMYYALVTSSSGIVSILRLCDVAAAVEGCQSGVDRGGGELGVPGGPSG